MPENLTKHNILLFEKDFERLKEFHPAESPTSVVRTLVRAHIRRMEALGPSETEKMKEFV